LEIHNENDSSIKEYLSDIFLYEQFLSFATLEAVACSKIYLYDGDLYQELENEKKNIPPSGIDIYIQLSNENDATHTEKYNFLFDYNTIKHQYSQIIQKWSAEKEDIAPIRTHLVESIKHKNIFSSIDFLIVVQALEGFCTRFRKEDSLSNMLQDIIEEFSCIDKIKNDDIIINEVVNSRHYYYHFMERSKKKHILNGRELYNLTHKLRKLLICCVLHFIGFNYPQINEILNKSNSYLL